MWEAELRLSQDYTESTWDTLAQQPAKSDSWDVVSIIMYNKQKTT